MSANERDQLWAVAYRTLYNARFGEVVAERIVARWQALDDFARVVIALTASGSAVTGWSLWQTAAYRNLWVVFAGTGAVLSIVHSALGVPARLTYWTDLRKTYGGLRNSLETFQDQMRIRPDFDLTTFTRKYLAFRDELGKADQRSKPDLMASRRAQRRWQNELNTQLTGKNAVNASTDEERQATSSSATATGSPGVADT